MLQYQKQRLSRTVGAAGIVSLASYIMVLIFSPGRPLPYSDTMTNAAQIMEKAVTITGSYCDTSGIKIDGTIDPNHTGLIGPEYSELMTTVGHLEAKRTTTIPDIAGLIVHLLDRAGVNAGDTVAIGCSASFPALMVASLAAAQAVDVYPVIIISLGASSYGATNTEFNMLDIYNLLLNEKVFNVQPAAVSLGGKKDTGQDFESGVKERLMQQIQLSGIPFIYESDLRKNVSMRMKIYEGNSSGSRISAFINIGGSYANFGTSQLALTLKPGLNKKIPIPSKEERGVLYEMAARDVPVIHLLYIKGLALEYGLPWDPVPLPKPAETKLHDTKSYNTIQFWIISIIYFMALFILVSRKEKMFYQCI
ncbi:hypothetical protein AMJ80_04405 [bacterium SM23_31]|nr:MAG: hypothetical protein AMJ80_04405 [bacterium SM23_31]